MNEKKPNVKFLSKEATDEIEGDDLCFLIAFNKKGEIVPYYRHIETRNDECCQYENPLNFIKLSFKDIDDGFSNVPITNSLYDSEFTIPQCYAYRVMRRVRLCDDGSGEWVDCSPNPCP